MTKVTLSLAAFTDLLKQHCGGDWWDKVLPILPDPEHTACEACGMHPLTTEDAATLNRILETVRNAGGPAPTSVWKHCGNDLFVDWNSDDGRTNLVWLDVNNRFGRDALVRLGDDPTYFVKVGDAT